MPQLTILSPSQQVATHLRDELLRGAWSGVMPGVPLLAANLGVDRKTIDAALRLLEEEGLLVAQGVGKRRRITLAGALAKPSLRIAILLCEVSDRRLDYIVELYHELLEAGHAVFFAEYYMMEHGMDVRRIARMVEQTEADAWVVLAGSRELLEWFSAQVKPAFALFGRRRRLPIAGAGPNNLLVIAEVTRALLDLGHRRIVMLVRPRRRLPKPGAVEQAFLDELANHDLPISDYNLPGWEETVEGFHARLASLFRITPPTALIVEEPAHFVAAQQFLARRRIRVPEDVSLVCMDADTTFDWCLPQVAHIRWESRPVVRRVVSWAANVSRGKPDFRQTLTLAEFVPGGTIGPEPA